MFNRQSQSNENISAHNLLWEGIRMGDKDAFFKLYHLCHKSLSTFGLRICADPDLVSETLNQIFLSLWEKYTLLERVDKVESYLRTILKRKLLKALSQQHRLEKAILIFGQEEDGMEMPYEEILIRLQTDDLVRLKLQDALQKLTQKQKLLIELRFFEGLSYDDVAKKTNLTLRTAYNTIYEAIKFLRKELDI